MKVKIKEKEINLPDFLIVGAAKSGTTSLYHYLKQHPQIFMPENKEPWFFSFAEATKKDEEIFNRKNIITDFNEYLNLFNDAKVSQIFGEASTCYLYIYKNTIENIKKYYSNWKELKIIIVLRNPTDRAFSHYLSDITIGHGINLSFKEVIEKWKLKQLSRFYNYIDYGFYFNQIKSYKDNFNKVKIYLFEDLETNPSLMVCDLFDFLNVDDSFVPDTRLKYNPTIDSTFLGNLIYKPNLIKGTIKALLPYSIRTKIKGKIAGSHTLKLRLEDSEINALKKIYREDILKLQELINRDLAHWLN
ncbi:MAG: sulfotransferase [Candidatus Kuenenia stuttgartiensis]|nr:sulfotransferase [Candidatus Kuenenia stuttgartiensis]